ncbi:hypothetical protein RHECNPAF_280013 [Rhizobium etli CNPAF512]|nr:hypothetical protein RHECNPAF_280013 [Rhizobium etli CNPAF512]
MPGRPICAAPPTRSITAARCRLRRASSSTSNRRGDEKGGVRAAPPFHCIDLFPRNMK